MSPHASELFEAARVLSQDERAELASALWETVEEDWNVQLSPEWQAEIARRIKESDEGSVASIPAEEVHRRLREKFGFLRE